MVNFGKPMLLRAFNLNDGRQQMGIPS